MKKPLIERLFLLHFDLQSNHELVPPTVLYNVGDKVLPINIKPIWGVT